MMGTVNAHYKSRNNTKAMQVFLNSTSTEAHLRAHIQEVGGAAWCQTFRFNGAREDFKSPALIGGGTLLHQCWEHGSEMLTRVLLEMGVPVNARDDNGHTVLHHACGGLASRCDDSPEAYYKVLECKVPMLVAAGADMMLTDLLRRTPLVLALIRRASVPAIHELLKHGANARQVDHKGHTMLHCAEHYQYDAALQAFLDLKCVDIDGADAVGATVLHHACGCSPTNDNDSRSSAARIQMLVAAGPNLELKDYYGHTPLNWAAEAGCMQAIHTLLKHGANVQTVDHENTSILQHAALGAHAAVVQLFLDMKCLDIDHQDKYGFSVLHYCELTTLPLLLQRGANMSTKNHAGLDALDYWKSEPDVTEVEQKAAIWTIELRHRCRAKAEAFAMGHHERLGSESRVRGLELGVVKMIISFAFEGKMHDTE